MTDNSITEKMERVKIKPGSFLFLITDAESDMSDAVHKDGESSRAALLGSRIT